MRVAWFAAITFAVGVLGLLLASRYTLVPGSSRGFLAWRLDRWTGEVCEILPGERGPEFRCVQNHPPAESAVDALTHMRQHTASPAAALITPRPPIEDALRAAGVTPQPPHVDLDFDQTPVTDPKLLNQLEGRTPDMFDEVAP